MILPYVNEGPLYLPVDEASARSGLDAETVRVLTLHDPHVDDAPLVRSEVGRSGDLLVHIIDLREIAETFIESGLVELPAEITITF